MIPGPFEYFSEKILLENQCFLGKGMMTAPVFLFMYQKSEMIFKSLVETGWFICIKSVHFAISPDLTF